MRWTVAVLSLAFSAVSLSEAVAAPANRPLDFGAPGTEERVAFEACLSRSGKTCLGLVQAACLKRPASETTSGMVGCAEKERRLWEERAQSIAASLRSTASPGQLAALDSAWSQFEHWRAAKCAYAATLYEGGSLSRVVAAECAMQTTADWSNALAQRLANERQ